MKIAIIGTGAMATGHAVAFNQIEGSEVSAACDTNPSVLSRFAKKYAIPNTYDHVDKLLDDGKFDAVTVVTPDPYHHPIVLKVIDAGYPVLCEKPLAVNHEEALEMQQAAEAKGVINMVNFTYRNAPAIQEASKVVRRGELGKIIHFDAHYYQGWIPGKYWGDYRKDSAWQWRLSYGHGSKGVLGDIGVHLIDFVDLGSGENLEIIHSTLKTFDKDKVQKYKFDANDTAILVGKLSNGAHGTLQMTRWASGEKNSVRLRLYGTKGAILIDLAESETEFKISSGKDIDKPSWKIVKCPPQPTNFERFVRSVRSGQQEQPDFQTATKVQKTLDQAFIMGGAKELIL